MSIAAPPFLFLFLPVAIGIYPLLPRTRQLLFRNLFLLAVSLLFYAWGEPVFVGLLLVMTVLTWAFGKLAAGKGYTATGNCAVFLTVLMNIGILVPFAAPRQAAECIRTLTGKELSFFLSSLPLGLSFFAFHSISYVVDIYRGQCRNSPKLLDAALYLAVFFKMAQGPIVPYHVFEPQISRRSSSWNDVSSGIWRFAIGFCKKMLLAAPIMPVADTIFSADFSTLSLCDAWTGCALYMIVLYYDFSGYSDMAIGLAQSFGFRMPENFNYPYISTSIGEYWRRWHITLCAWFRDYLYFPIVLGPSVTLRKHLLRHHVSDSTAKRLQNIFVPSCVWLATALWHGSNWNYTLWGVVNSTAMIVEPSLPLCKCKTADRLARHAWVLLILLLTVPLIRTDSLTKAILYFKAMLAGTGTYAWSELVRYYLGAYWLFLLVGIAGSLRLPAWAKELLYPQKSHRMQLLWHAAEALLLLLAVVLAVGVLFKTGTITFMYQQ